MRRSSPGRGLVPVLCAAVLVASACARTGEATTGEPSPPEASWRGAATGTTAPPTATTSTAPTTASTTTSSVGAGTTTTAPPLPPAAEFPSFEPSEYGRLIDALEPAGTVRSGELPSITGDPVADARIRELAQGRGYRPRPVSVVSMTGVDGVPVHPDVEADLRALLAEARFFGMSVGVTSGHRSPERQRQIFVRELGESAHALRGRAVEPAEIAAGQADDVVVAALEFHSIPGYSRHHSGHTVDLDAGGALADFEGSPVEEWLRADDFANAKRFGFVPSYPRGSDPQGPRPEPWEFVHVGSGTIRCAVLHVPLADLDAARSCPLLEG